MAEEIKAVQQGYYHIATNPQLYEIARSSNFELVVQGLNGITRVDNAGKKIDNAEDVIRFSCVSVDVPSFTQEAIEVKYGNNSLGYAGKPAYSKGNVVLNDFIGADGKSVLMAWQNLSYNINTWSIGRASEYKKDAFLLEYDPSWTLVRTWKLYGCWIGSVESPAYSSESDEKRTITAKLNYDYARMEAESSNT